MRPEENCVDSSKVMEMAFQNILNEIVEHVIEGVCFEVHRGVKLGYYPVDEYFVTEGEFEIYSKEKVPNPEPDVSIFPFEEDVPKEKYQKCFYCKQNKDVKIFARHLKSCPSKLNGSLGNTDKEENIEDDFEDEYSDDDDSCDRSPNYDYMSTEERQDFLDKYCGVVSSYTGKRCSNPIICNKHTDEDKNKVRHGKILPDYEYLADGNIDIDTVD